MRGLPSILSLLCNEFYKLNSTIALPRGSMGLSYSLVCFFFVVFLFLFFVFCFFFI